MESATHKHHLFCLPILTISYICETAVMMTVCDGCCSLLCTWIYARKRNDRRHTPKKNQLTYLSNRVAHFSQHFILGINYIDMDFWRNWATITISFHLKLWRKKISSTLIFWINDICIHSIVCCDIHIFAFIISSHCGYWYILFKNRSEHTISVQLYLNWIIQWDFNII